MIFCKKNVAQAGLVTGMILSAINTVQAGTTQITDFRLTTNAPGSSGTYYYYNSFSYTTRVVTGTPLNIYSTFSGTSQSVATEAVDPANDIGLKTYTSATTIVDLNRYTASSTVPRVGAIQWSVDLSSLGNYLTTNSLALSALDLSLVLQESASTKYDVYISYTSAGEGLTLSGISSTSASDNYNVWSSAQSSSVGSVINGSYKILALNATSVSTATLSESLLALYNSGITKFNVVIMSGDYWAGRSLTVYEGSGISMTTAAVPEPASVLTMAAGAALLLRRGAGRSR